MSPSDIIALLALVNAATVALGGWILHTMSGVKTELQGVARDLAVLRDQITPSTGPSLPERVRRSETDIAVLQGVWGRS